MIDTILGSKEKMSQTFVGSTRVPVTWITAGPCIVTQIKHQDKDGYWAVQLGFGERRIKNVNKQLQGHLKKTPKFQDSKTQKLPRYLREVRLENEPQEKVGDEINVSDLFKKGDIVRVTGISKGKGFAGVVKRWKFAGGPRTHGQSDRERAPGSIGQGTTPGRVLKGKKMAGRMGQDRVSVKNLVVVEVDKEKGKVAVSGPVPGSTGSLLILKKISEGKLSELEEVVAEVQMQVEEEEADIKTESKEEEVKKENVQKLI